MLITEADAVVWLPSLGEDGFGAAHRVLGGPPATFGADLFLADMSGDGLTDLVRIRNGEVVYWPNLGHGRFGAAVTMDAAPRFDRDELFDPGRLRLVDVDGSGVTDIIYSGPEEIRLYFNRSGNGFSEAYSLGAPPDVDGDVAAVDLFGTGTACLVWSSQTPGEQRSLRCMDLLGGVKPHLLVQVDNNLGARTEIEYAPSTADFLADAQAGRPWRTRLPFPVHVVRHAQTTDLVTGNRSSVRYVYHDGYFDGADREFRGFGLIEQWDADFADGPGAAPPVLTKTWHHLGVDLDAGDQYWQAPGPPEIGVGPTRLPAGLTAQERHEALRALKGKMLRQEVYAADGTDREPLPYSVTEYAYGVRVLQPQGEHKHAVCLPYAAETVSRHYERILYDVELNGEAVRRTDPRIVQELTLEVDDWGNRLRTATFAYPRRFPDAHLDPLLSAEERRHIAGAQTLLRASLAESDFTNAVESALDHRAPMPAGTRRYELLDVTPATLDQPLPDIAFTDDSATGPGRRLVERTLTRYRRDDLTGALATGVLEPLALPYESYQLAFTPAILDRAYGSLLEQPASVLGVDAGHVYFEGAWWIPGGQVAYSADSAHTAAQELAYAREHFFLPLRYADAFGGTTVVAYDAYDLLVLDTVDPAGNRVSAGERANAAEPAQESLTSALDYQALAARVVSDANRNRSAVAFDALGMVVATAARGKPEENLGDSVDAVLTHPTAEQIAAYFADPVSQSGLLGGATTRSLFDLQAFWRTRDDAQPQPVTVATLSCDAHQDPTGRVTHRIVYSDGFGREIQTKSQAEPQQPGGPARWAASGWIVYTAKNRPARRYEPFFTDTDRYEAGHTAGVSAVTCYDPIGRAVAVLMPDGSFTKSVFTPWRNDDWDANDTVLLDPRTDPDVGPYARAWLTDPQWRTWWQQREGGELGAAEQQAAVKAQAHAGTPASGYADTLGATAATVAALPDERQVIRYHRDGEGAVRQVVDARGITVTATFYDLAGRALHTRIADGGDQRMVPDVAGTPVRRWNARGQAFRHEYDSLRRGTHIWLGDQLVGLTVFGDAEPDGPALNLRGKPRLIFDGAGLTEALRYDFKGNMLAGRRRLSPAPNADWSTLDGLSFAQLATAWEELLEPEVFSFASDYDALNRKVLQVLPDSTVVTTAYNEAGLLERISVKLPGQVAEAPVVAGVAYTAIGRREEVEYGNGVRSVFEHDPATHRLRRITTLRGSTPVQDLSYVYDAVGNVVATADGAQSAVFFAGQVTLPGSQFTYDAVYRLVEASGREHSSLGGPPGHENPARPPLPHPNDPQALRNYTQRFAYDPAGNLTSLEHLAGVGSFSRAYSYDLAANRLLSHTDPSGPVTFQYDEHGNLLGFPHADLTWDHDDRLTEAGLGPGGPHARYWYDGGGTRVRKVVEHQGGLVEERVYQHGYEIYRRRLNGTLVFERRTVAVFDDQRRLALIETVTVDTAAGEPAGVARWRFQLEDLVHSACLELDETAAVISYEEYHPYGTTSLWLAAGAAEVSAKRYRYTGKERDDETGLYYHGARYYAPWIARWTAVDPAQTRDGESPYMYVRGNPVRFFDPDGEDCGEQQSSLPILASMFPGSVGWAVRPQVNPCLANHPDPRVQAWGKWKAEGDKAAALKSATFHRDVSAVAAGTTTAFYTAAYATVTGGPVAMAAADKAAIWALANPAKAALVETLVQFGIGIVDPHPAGFSPMDMPGPADDFGRLARGTVVRKVEEVMGADELVKLSVRHMKPQQIVKAIKETWALDKQGLAKWRGEILEGALAATRYKFFEWVGRLNNGFFRGLDFYANGIGIQVKTLHAIPKVSAYKGYIDSLLELKRGGVTPDGRALREVALDIVLPVGYKGPKGKEAAFDAALTEIKDYGQQLGIPVNVYRTSLEQLNLMQVAK